MECPFCRVYRYKSEWMPSQWRQSSPKTEYYNCCKQCSDTGFVAHSPLVHKAFETLVAEASLLLTNSKRRQYIQTFFNHWMGNLSWKERKDLSHEGALSRTHGDAADHDPGNHVYSFALSLVFPEMASQWNAVTVGDLLESVLGYAQLAGCRDHWLPAWINRYVLAVEAFLQEVPHNRRSQIRSWQDCEAFVNSCRPPTVSSAMALPARTSSSAMAQPVHSSDSIPMHGPSSYCSNDDPWSASSSNHNPWVPSAPLGACSSNDNPWVPSGAVSSRDDPWAQFSSLGAGFSRDDPWAQRGPLGAGPSRDDPWAQWRPSGADPSRDNPWAPQQQGTFGNEQAAPELVEC